jgi:hypothetical protein
MYRKVHNTMLAFSATGLLLLVGLMAGAPMQSPAPATEVRTLAIGPLLVRLESPANAKALPDIEDMTAEEAASALVRAAFVAAAFDAADPSSEGDEAAAGADDTQRQRRHVRRAREALALPYFSFAQGLRRNRS